MGKAIATEFVREGSHVAICARNGELFPALVAELQEAATGRQKILATECDVSSEVEVHELFRRIELELGSVDVLVQAWPNLMVDKGIYRLRLTSMTSINDYRFGFSNGMPFWVIGSDAGLLDKPVKVAALDMSSAERYDILVDFTQDKKAIYGALNELRIPGFAETNILLCPAGH